VGKRTGGQSAPTTVNSSVRTREYLTTAEIERLMGAARKSSRYGHRDATMILIGYRHGLRASELCDLQWSQIELATGRLHVRRAKNGSPSVHPMQGDEIRALRRLQREQGPSSHVFMTERDGPMTPKAFHALFGRIGLGPKCRFRPIRTCCDTAAAMPWRTRATTRGRFRHGSGTRISSTRCDTLS
jgi:integrase